MCKIELDGTQGRTAKINNRRPTHLQKTRNHCIQPLDLLLCRGNTKVTTEDIDIIMNAFKNKNIFTMHSRQSMGNMLQLLMMRKYAEEKKYLNTKKP